MIYAQCTKSTDLSLSDWLCVWMIMNIFHNHLSTTSGVSCSIPTVVKCFGMIFYVFWHSIIHRRPTSKWCSDTSIFSLHIRSMWETICDAWACWSGWKFGPNSTVYPYSAIQNTPPPEMKIVRNLGTLTFQLQNTPPPENWNLGRSWHFVIFQVQITPPPKLRQILALCDF